MLNQFNEEYKNIMLSAEQRVKQLGYKEISPEDVIIQMAALQSGNTYDLFSSFGLNDSILIDVLSRPPFFDTDTPRDGSYIGISQRVKDLIVMSMKIAASFQKSQAGIEDFLLALYRIPTENWFYQMLDFVGVSPKDFETQVIEINTMIASASLGKEGEPGTIFSGVDEIVHMLEENFGIKNEGDTPIGSPSKDPFSQNKKQEKSDSKTPALDFFGRDLTARASEGQIDPVIGRDIEVDRLISVLNRKTKNNPCLVGDPGVGKTAVVE